MRTVRFSRDSSAPTVDLCHSDHAREHNRFANQESVCPDIDNGSITDITWQVKNTGNTTAAFNVNLFLANAAPPGIKTQLVLHTSAAHGVRVLDPARPAGIIPLAVHPALSFTGTSIDLARLREAWCAVTAPSPVLPIAQALVVEMGAEPIVVSEEHRAAYADAIQSASDFSTAIVSQAMGALRDIGVDEPGRVLGAVVRSAVENALRSATVDSIDLAALADRGADAHAEPDPRDDRPDPLDRPDPGAA